MAVFLSPVGGAGAQFFDNNGNPLTGGKLYTYEAGTTTPEPTYTTSAGNVAHANPVVFDAAGRVPGSSEIWLTDNQAYKFVLKDSNDVLIATWDNISGINDVPDTNAVNVAYDPPFTGALTSGYTVQDRLAQTVSVKDFGAVGDGVTDDYAAIAAAWDYCYPIGASLYFPSGTYLVVTENFPFRNPQLPVTELLDCHNMTICGDGPSSILKTSSIEGADVLQWNGLKNFHLEEFQ